MMYYVCPRNLLQNKILAFSFLSTTSEVAKLLDFDTAAAEWAILGRQCKDDNIQDIYVKKNPISSIQFYLGLTSFAVLDCCVHK